MEEKSLKLSSSKKQKVTAHHFGRSSPIKNLFSQLSKEPGVHPSADAAFRTVHINVAAGAFVFDLNRISGVKLTNLGSTVIEGLFESARYPLLTYSVFHAPLLKAFIFVAVCFQLLSK